MIVTQSASMQKLIHVAQRAAKSTAPVLLTGESGTGKELFAELIHRASPRCTRVFSRVNCAALSSTLIESELFGHEKGAFTDANSARVGRFEQAHQGSLLLDEVSEIPIESQAKLLRVLESGEFERVGSCETTQQDVRVIAASNRDLQQEVKLGSFRLDLLHRINIIELKIPPLRDRLEDLPALAMHFINRFCNEGTVVVEGFTKEALAAMASHSWPGNIRELRNVVHRACVLTESKRIGENDLRLEVQPAKAIEPTTIPDRWLELGLDEVERQLILTAIKRFGSQRIAAQQLGVSQRTLTNKVRKYREAGRVELEDGRESASPIHSIPNLAAA